MPEPPHRLSQYPLGRMRIECRVCGRQGSWSVARLAVEYGAEADLIELLLVLTSSCRWQRRPGDRLPKQYQQRCLAFYPDLAEREPEPSTRMLRLIRNG